MNAEKELLHRDLTKDIIDSLYKVHNAVGCGLLEKIYGNALVWELGLKKRKVVSQQEFGVFYREKNTALIMLIWSLRTK